MPLCIAREGELRRDGVDGIDHVVDPLAIHREDLLDVLAFHEEVGTDHLAVGIDVEHHLAHDLDLAPAHGAVERDGLTVEVAQRHRITVDEHQPSDTTPREGLDTTGTDPSQPKHHDGRRGKAGDALGTHDALET